MAIYKLRPIKRTDLEIIHEWRNSRAIRKNMYTDHAISWREHREWFSGLDKDPTRCCMIFDVDNRPAGVINISQINDRDKRCEWGFYLGNRNVPRGSGIIMGYLALEFIFRELRIRKLCSTAFAFNQASIRYHQKLQFRQEGKFVRHVLKNGRYRDVIAFALFKKDWITAKEKIRSRLIDWNNQ